MGEFSVNAPLKVLAIDIGGTNVKILASGQKEGR
jgi:hexokinase